jgi:glucan 1,3-beta-glucosidase
MRFLALAFAIAPAVLLGTAEKLDIPQVDEVVQHVLEENSDYVHYQAPPGTSNKTSKSEAAQNVKAAAASGQAYWYEQIDHQGISAFGPSGYKVYRNVKDYGAKGTSSDDSFTRRN